jgi:arylamine N-acetyltransferase
VRHPSIVAPVDDYLARLGLEREPPSAEALARLHRAHVERVPYETLWIHLGEAWGIDTGASFERVATRRRGGYCYHLNGSLSELLRRLGYDVVRHVGGVHGPAGPSADDLGNHLVLTVRGLPTDGNPGGHWYVDAGLGDGLHDPLPLVPGTYTSGPYRLVLRETPGGVGDWHLEHDAAGGIDGMAWRSAPVGMDAFAERHVQLSTDPASGFVRVLTAQRRDATGADTLKGLVLRRVGDRPSSRDLGSLVELTEVLGDLFGLDLSTVDREARQALWRRLSAAHDTWVTAGRR